jgi:uncharacterized protein (TIGR03067 family)
MGLVILLFGQSPEDKNAADPEKLQGSWRMIYAEHDGDGLKPKNDVRISFEKDVHIEWSSGEMASKSSFKIDGAKKPKTMEVTILENRLIPESKGTKIIMIYELDGDRLKTCKCSGGKLPTEFTTKENDGRALHIYERVKP